MFTVVPPTVAPLAVPVLLTAMPPASAILIATPEAGCVLGNATSVAIASNPPNGSNCAAT